MLHILDIKYLCALRIKFFLCAFIFLCCLLSYSALASQKSSVITGSASFISSKFKWQKTASGETYFDSKFTAAHRSLPFGTIIKVTRLSNKREVIVRINDRGPYAKKRILDLSLAGAKKLNMLGAGVTTVQIEVIAHENGIPVHSDHNFFIKLATGKENFQEIKKKTSKHLNKNDISIFKPKIKGKKHREFIGIGPFKEFAELEKILYALPGADKYDILYLQAEVK